jgi:hypothetical protein
VAGQYAVYSDEFVPTDVAIVYVCDFLLCYRTILYRVIIQWAFEVEVPVTFELLQLETMEDHEELGPQQQQPELPNNAEFDEVKDRLALAQSIIDCPLYTKQQKCRLIFHFLRQARRLI